MTPTLRTAVVAFIGDVARIRAMGVDAFIAQQLRPERIADARLESWLSQFETLDLSYTDTQKAYPRPANALQQLNAENRNSLSPQDSAEFRRIAEGFRKVTTEVQSARIGRALITERQLDEVVTDFWLNHFSVFQGKGVNERFMLAEYENTVIRPRALGKFRDLLGAVAKSPAMLFYCEGRDLALTTDFRSVFNEVLTSHLGATGSAGIFPGFASPARVGLFG